jgi:acetylglutamate kinase
MMKHDPTLEQIAELMDEMEAYHHRTVVIKIGGNSIAEDEHFLSKIARQVKFLRQNGVYVILIHGGGPQIDDALRDAGIVSTKGKDGRRITSPKAMRVVAKTMNKINRDVADALVEAGCRKDKIVQAAKYPRLFVTAEPLDKKDRQAVAVAHGAEQSRPNNVVKNRSGKPKAVAHENLLRLLEQNKVVVLHSIGIGKDGKSLFNINGDDYAMAVAIAIKAKRLILVTNVAGVLDQDRKRIPSLDREMAEAMIADGTISGGMVPKVESALWVVKQGVGGVAIIDGFAPWAILAEMLTHEGFGTLVQARIG